MAGRCQASHHQGNEVSREVKCLVFAPVMQENDISNNLGRQSLTGASSETVEAVHE